MANVLDESEEQDDDDEEEEDEDEDEEEELGVDDGGVIGRLLDGAVVVKLLLVEPDGADGVLVDVLSIDDEELLAVDGDEEELTWSSFC